MTFDVDAFLDGYEHRVEEVVIYSRGDLVATVERLQEELVEAVNDDTDLDRVRDLNKELTSAQEHLEASRAVFRFRSIPRDQWAALVVEHPPSDEDKRRHPGVAELVGESFWPHAIAACSLEPELTVEQAKRMASLRTEDFDQLRVAVKRANEEAVAAPKSQMATAVARLLDGDSTAPRRSGSRGKSGTAANGKASRSTSTTTKRAG